MDILYFFKDQTIGGILLFLVLLIIIVFSSLLSNTNKKNHSYSNYLTTLIITIVFFVSYGIFYLTNNANLLNNFFNTFYFGYFVVFVLFLIFYSIFAMFNITGNITKNVNTSVYISAFLIFILACLSKQYKANNITNIKALDVLNLRQNIFLFLLFFLFCVINLFVLNPYDIGTNFSFVFYTLIPIITFFILLIYLSLTDIAASFEKRDDFVHKKGWNIIFDSLKQFLVFFIVFVVCIIIIHFLFTSIFNLNVNESLLSNIIKWIFILFAFYIFYRLTIKSFLDSNNYVSKIAKFLENTLFFIPCFFIDLCLLFIKQYNLLNPQQIILLGFLFLIILLTYIYLTFYPKIKKNYYLSGGNQLLNEPIGLENETVIAKYIDLYHSESINKDTLMYQENYNYCISFWMYIDSLPPNTRASYVINTPILNYGYNPLVTFNPSTNTLIVSTMNMDDYNKCITNTQTTTTTKTTEEIKDECLNNNLKQLYKDSNYEMQKWNNIILNFNSGTLDIFYNGELVSSKRTTINISSNTPIVVGSSNGISGGICNVVFFNKTIGSLDVKRIYDLAKNKNPPLFFKDTIIPNIK